MTLSLRFGFRQQQYILRCRIGFLLFCLFFISLFCALGQWQLYRYYFKQNLLASYHERAAAVPVSLISVVATQKDLQFQRVSIQGRYLNNQTLLIQNRFYNEQPGFEVMTPLQVVGQNKIVLIDRGWIAKPHDAALPVIPPAVDQPQVVGSIKLLNESQFILGPNILQPKQKPIVIQKIDINEIGAITHAEFYPFIVRLGAEEKNGFVRDWTIIAVNPERHLGYAFQWFLMAIALAIAYVCFCLEKVGNKNHANS